MKVKLLNYPPTNTCMKGAFQKDGHVCSMTSYAFWPLYICPYWKKQDNDLPCTAEDLGIE